MVVVVVVVVGADSVATAGFLLPLAPATSYHAFPCACAEGPFVVWAERAKRSQQCWRWRGGRHLALVGQKCVLVLVLVLVAAVGVLVEVSQRLLRLCCSRHSGHMQLES